MRSALAGPTLLGFLAVGSLLVPTAGVAETVTALLDPQDDPSGLVGRLGDAEELAAVALGPRGERAAGALPVLGKDRRSVVRLVSAGESQSVDLEMPGQVRSLVFDSGGAVLFALMHRPAKRGGGEAWLVRIEVDSLKARKEMRLPPEASGLALAGWGDTLLIAADNAVRTVLLPDLRSGPLYQVPGKNGAVASASGSTRVVLGQSDRLVVIDVDDRPGDQGMPVRASIPVQAAVTAILLSPDGGGGRARLEDRSIVRFWLDPLRLEEAPPPAAQPPGPAPVVEETVAAPPAPVPAPAPEPTAGPEPATAEPESTGPPAEPEPAAVEPPAVEPSAEPEPGAAEPQAVEPSAEPEPGAAEPQAVEPPAEPEPAATEPPAVEPPAEPEPAAAEPPAVEPPAEPGEHAEPQLRGSIAGPAAARAREVLLLGPDSVIHIAARVKIGEGGDWAVSGLPPGRYRIQVAADPGDQLITDPPFGVVDLEPDVPVTAPTMRVLRAL